MSFYSVPLEILYTICNRPKGSSTRYSRLHPALNKFFTMSEDSKKSRKRKRDKDNNSEEEDSHSSKSHKKAKSEKEKKSKIRPSSNFAFGALSKQ